MWTEVGSSTSPRGRDGTGTRRGDGHRLRLALCLLALLGCGAAYTGLTFVAPLDTFWSPDNGGKFIQMQNLRLQGGLDRSVVYPGRELDPLLQFVPFYFRFHSVQQGQILLQWPLIFPLLSAPLYNLLGYAGLHLLPLLCGIASLAVVLLLCHRMKWPWPLLTLLLVALTTPLALYSAEFWEHTPAIFLSLLAVWALLRSVERGQWGFLLAAGVLLAVACSLRLELYMAFPAAALALVLSPPTERRPFRAALVFLGIGLVALLLTVVLYGWTTGRMLPASFNDPIPPMTYLREIGWSALADFFVGSARDLGIAASLPWKMAFAIAALLAIGLAFLPWARWRTPLLALAYGTALLAAAVIAVQDPTPRAIHGALIATPVLLFAWVPLTKREVGGCVRFLGILGALYLLGYAVAGSQWGDWIGGLEWGSRYALLAYPLLVPAALLGLCHLWQENRRALWRWAFLGLFLGMATLSVCYQARGVQTFLRERQISHERLVFLDEFCPPDVVTDLWWLSSDMASRFYGRRFFLLTPEHGLDQWVARAARGGEGSFCLVRTDPSPAKDLEALVLAGEVVIERVGQSGNLVFTVGRLGR